MRHLKPYQTLAGAKAALDNGGRFYNLLSIRDDNTIQKAELNKAAGVFRSEQKAFLFLHMALADLSEDHQAEVLAMLEAPLAKRYRIHGPRRVAPTGFAGDAKAGQLVVVEGYPRFLARKSEKTIVPMLIGKVVIPVPVDVHYDGYQVFSTPNWKGPAAGLFVKRPKEMLAESCTRFGGIIRSFTSNESPNKTSTTILEPLFFSECR